MTLVEMINAMILNAKLSFNLWGVALLTACHVHNRIPSRKFKFHHMSCEKVENQIWDAYGYGAV
jgi:hypothetical protein